MTYQKIYDDSPEQNKIIDDRDDYEESFKSEIDSDDDYDTVTEEE